MQDVENGESVGGSESIRFTERKSDVGREIISRVTFTIGLAHEVDLKIRCAVSLDVGLVHGSEFIRKLLKVDRHVDDGGDVHPPIYNVLHSGRGADFESGYVLQGA